MKIPTQPAGGGASRPVPIIVPPLNSIEPCDVDASYQHPARWRVCEDADPLILRANSTLERMLSCSLRTTTSRLPEVTAWRMPWRLSAIAP